MTEKLVRDTDGHDLPEELIQHMAFRSQDSWRYRPGMLLDREHGRPDGIWGYSRRSDQEGCWTRDSSSNNDDCVWDFEAREIEGWEWLWSLKVVNYHIFLEKRPILMSNTYNLSVLSSRYETELTWATEYSLQSAVLYIDECQRMHHSHLSQS